jgi:hypothetical protein
MVRTVALLLGLPCVAIEVGACTTNTVVDESENSVDAAGATGVTGQSDGPSGSERVVDSSSNGSPGASSSDGDAGATQQPDVVEKASDGAYVAPAPAWPDASPPASGVSFPFPQHRSSPHCSLATGSRPADVQAAYAQWYKDTVVAVPDAGAGALRIQRLQSDPENSDGCTPHGSTVSEGIGYGMLIAVFMGEQPLFDGLWIYEQQHLDSNGLMNWAPNGVPTDPSQPECGGGATDADEDMAFALVMADKQWGGQGTLTKTYLAYAKQQITNIWNTEIRDSKLAAAGDGSWAGWSNVNISYFAPAYYRAFANVDPTHNWAGASSGSASVVDGGTVVDTVYDTIESSLNSSNSNQNNGLVPAWCNEANSTCGASGSNPFYYQYDSCRTPFRIALDWCWNGEPRAQAYLAKTSAFFSAIGAKNIVDGYALNGSPKAGHPADGGVFMQSAAFVGPAGVGAMSSASMQSFVDDAYADVATLQLLVGGTYYEDSWSVMSLLMLTGNFLDYGQL